MNKRLQIFLLSLLTPGLGYLQTGGIKCFYKTIALFFSVIIAGLTLKLFTTFLGFASIIVVLFAIYIFAAIHAALKMKPANSKIQTSAFLKIFFTATFIFITALSFANRRKVMGFDIMRMSVAVMEPTVLQDERFLVNTRAYINRLPQRGEIVAHSFNAQQGLYLNRIIAIENDKIEIKNGIVFLNGQKLSEPYCLSINVTKPQSKHMQVITIPKGHYFVMGDNRDASFGDSRFSGTITIDNIVSKITDIINSPNKSRIGINVK